jgi:LDH2 family malate/lactate/ureidoglycolate dehydrogenase
LIETTLNSVLIDTDILTDFCTRVFLALGVPESDAVSSAQVLVAANVRGIPSHGVGRLWRYVNGIESGLILPDAPVATLMDTPTSLVVNANGTMGAPVSIRTMERLIEKARTHGAAFGCVQDSNHFGIAGYYAMMAMEHDMLGIAMTNSGALAVPTFGCKPMLGTNPLAFAAPAGAEKGFVLDMSTTVITRGKVEVYDRLNQQLPNGWVVDRTGRPAHDPALILQDLSNRTGGGILPLGGEGEMFGGHKGYGLAVMVDILCSVLCGAPFGPNVADTKNSSARVSHFFGAIKIDTFRDPDEFRQDMDRMLGDLRSSQPAEGCDRIYYAGLKEFEAEENSRRNGVDLLEKTYRQICEIGDRYGIHTPELVGS